MTIQLGSTAISTVYLGSTEADRVYLGSELIWESAASAFSPLDIPWNHAFWADDLGYAAPADGANITVDPTDHGSDATVWSRNNTPTWVANMANTGKSAMSSIGINGLWLLNQSIPATRTVVVVGRALGTFQDSDFFDTIDPRSLFDTNGGKWRLFAGANFETTGDADNDVHLFIAKFMQSGNETLEIDGVQVLDGNAGLLGGPNGNLHIGGAGAWGAGNVDGSEIAFVGYIHGELTAQQKSDLLAWFQSEYVV